MRLQTVLVGLLACVLIAGCVTQTSSTGGTRRESSDSGREPQFDARVRAKARTDLAGGYFELRNFGVALEEVRSAMAADPSYGPAHAMHALIQMELKDMAQAQVSFDRALRLDPQDPDLLHNYGWFLCETGRIDQGLERFTAAIRDPLYASPAKSYATAGLCLLRANRSAEAISRFESALRIDAGYAPAMLPLARLKYQGGDTEGARVLISRLGETVAQSAEAMWVALLVERRRGDAQAEASIGLQLRRRFPESREAQALQRGQYELVRE